jgi:hypothetical protein
VKPPHPKAIARAQGLARYFTGLPCPHGHLSERRTIDGNCVECTRVRDKYRYNDNTRRVSMKNANDKRRMGERGYKRDIVTSARKRARIYGLSFSITVDDIVWPKYCPILGVELRYGGKGHNATFSATLDRVDNSLGYIPGNVRVISRKANTNKGNLSLREIEALYRYSVGLPTSFEKDLENAINRQ